MWFVSELHIKYAFFHKVILKFSRFHKIQFLFSCQHPAFGRSPEWAVMSATAAAKKAIGQRSVQSFQILQVEGKNNFHRIWSVYESSNQMNLDGIMLASSMKLNEQN